MGDLLGTSLVQAVDAIAGKQVSARELTQASLDRAQALNPVLNAFISINAEQALEQADRADQAIASGQKLGLLHGVPLAHKDMFYRAGRISTCGSKVLREFVPDKTATVLSRLDHAGALDLGGLSMAEFAFGGTGHNHHNGPCRNPWDTDHISGGSSSGSGSATAARIIFGALGSDTGGSVRMPSAANGVFGIKPTQTRVSRYGAMGLSYSLDNIGPLARTARDCARLFSVIAGHDDKDPTTSHEPVSDYEAACIEPDVRGLRIGTPANYYYDGADSVVRDCMQKSLQVLSDLGAEIVEVQLPDHEHLADLTNLVMSSEAATLHSTWLRDRRDDYGPQVRARIENGFAFSATQYLTAIQRRPQITARFVNSVFSQCDALHAPTMNIVVPRIDETDVADQPGFAEVLGRITHCTRPANYLGVPSLAVPAGFIEGRLPASFQLIGRPFAESTLFKIGAAYERAAGWGQKEPSILA